MRGRESELSSEPRVRLLQEAAGGALSFSSQEAFFFSLFVDEQCLSFCPVLWSRPESPGYKDRLKIPLQVQIL